MRKVQIDGKDYYIEDANVDIGTGEALNHNSDENINKFDDTLKIKTINEEELLEDTITDLWGENND